MSLIPLERGERSKMTFQYLRNKDLLNKKLTVFFASRTVLTARVMACFEWATSLNSEIDKVLAKHYGFTEDGFDFVINYDIKYRMGNELNEE